MNLLVDIGNTRLKWGMATAGQMISGRSLVNSQISRKQLVELWQDVSPLFVAVSCVSAEKIAELVLATSVELWPDAKIIRVTSQAYALGVANAYSQPERLGVDRWLSLVAAHRQYHLPVCIVDCGTAITVDLMDDQGRHQGGMICPGLRLMKKSLAENTEALKFVDAKYDLGPSNCTEAAIYSGVLTAAIGLIEHVFAGQPDDSLLILTGGDAELIAEHLVYQSVIDPDLVLRGLAIVLEEIV